MAANLATKPGRTAIGPADESQAGQTGSGEAASIELDERGHAELLVAYRESSETVRFAKALMWKCVGATLLIQLSLVGIGFVTRPAPLLARIAVGAGIIVACGSIYALVIHQLWQNVERAKLDTIAKAMSEPLRTIRAMQSPREANFHRYTLLTFMIIVIAIGQIVASVAMSPLYD